MRIFLLWLITTVACQYNAIRMTLKKEITRIAIPEFTDGSVKQTGFIREAIYEGTNYAACFHRDDWCRQPNGVLVLALEIQLEISGYSPNRTNDAQIILDALDSEKNEIFFEKSCWFLTEKKLLRSESGDQKTTTCRFLIENFVIADNDCIDDKDKENCLSIEEDIKL